VAAGTAWLWSREEFAGSVDVLFVDEAGQMSLANVLALSPCFELKRIKVLRRESFRKGRYDSIG
jgi:hypothetical protein